MNNKKLGQEPVFMATTDHMCDNLVKRKMRPEGISKRLYIATKAMQGLLANSRITELFEKVNSEVEEERIALTKVSYEIADELLKQENE
jgi:hypothetical protein